MINEATLDITEAPGATGLLFDENPSATTSRIRPFVIGFLLLRGGVRRDEVAYSIHAHVSREDCLLGLEDENFTRLELQIDEVLAEFVAEGTLRSRDDGLYVITPAGMQKAIAWTCCLNAQLPDHLLNESLA